jgi:hypothetical protein
VHYFYESAKDEDCAEAIGIFDKMVDFDNLLGLWMVTPVMDALNVFVKLCQSRSASTEDLAECIVHLKDNLTEMYLGENACWSGRSAPTARVRCA